MASESLQPRRARHADAVSLADLWLRSRRASIPANPPTIHTDAEVREHFASVHLASHEVWLFEADEGPIALMVLDGHWIDELHVDPGSTGHGLGSRLVDLAKERRPSGLDLWTFQSNRGARRFYERHGFVAVEMTDGANEERAPDVRYRWSTT